LFDAIIFVVASCGFLPRSALESGTIADSRIERIARAIFSSKYSIHDLSKCKGEGSEQLARFNMPLELGIAMARRYGQPRDALKHDWLVLVPQGHNYAKFVSDLAGFDPQQYDGSVANLVRQVMMWLATRPDAVKAPTPKDVLDALPRFMAKKQDLRGQWGDQVPWADVVLAAQSVVPP
jgi:hypothetical protein